ncbi:TATA box-binding protein-associated factor RNA polymerase I subunit A [Callorhinchus milii]|uniref:TATA-box binding protein associated factor, RNA polymerase I subunit A n=1 Tax=Callorhinchus milii TaxID=7868 RepID=A0A4W3I7I9_CALMI|nr:TATA box-binding protein-associated factor RNA polymerase I subunit A [Callorhinchus milii]XP_007903191.1 TATA box-binding protein-associated factor RNA polymerase I subunit A [Callorhinchus milii]XP_007903194.1 TATA box-binding protein-associated factor RNA polymerase I subunit A [Callorhinchus milii]|eukprot:gi/632973509/ref/XP_007903190.1/ PREDICTED: TATA box-binding protein-associated factor RNA polymerase I subunit A [Callorhinchus milii]
MDELIAELQEETGNFLADDESAEVRGLCPEVKLPLPESVLQFQIHRSTKQRSFRRTAKVCLDYIRDALLQHQWQRAADLMVNLFEILEDYGGNAQKTTAIEIIWRLGSEILHNHPRSTVEDVISFSSKMKLTGVKNYLQKCLEHVIYLLYNGMLNEAYLELSNAETWRYGNISSSQSELIPFIQGYKALLDYCTWSKKYEECKKREEGEMDMGTEQEMHNYFRQASIGLNQTLQHPGVWDPFVLSYVNLLEFYDGFDEALKVLDNYAYDSKFPANPNAHVYLYELLKKNQSSPKKMIRVLKILSQMVPSHELMLDLNSLLVESSKMKNRKEGLVVLFNLLDFPSWKENYTVWKRLIKQMKYAVTERHASWMGEQWQLRQNWWPAFHFSERQARRNFEANASFAYRKATVAGLLMGKGCKYFITVYRLGRKVEKPKMKKMKQYIKEHSLRTPSGS